jgi:hypothetical protein
MMERPAEVTAAIARIVRQAAGLAAADPADHCLAYDGPAYDNPAYDNPAGHCPAGRGSTAERPDMEAAA